MYEKERGEFKFCLGLIIIIINKNENLNRDSPDELVDACYGAEPLVEGTNAVGKLVFGIQLVSLN